MRYHIVRRAPILPGGDVPPWFTALAHKQTGAPLSNWLGDSAVRDPNYNVVPYVATSGHAAIVKAYTGMGYDPVRRIVWMAGNGGHNDYAGNEVYASYLATAAPLWARRRDASGAFANDEQVHRQWPDGTPTSDHTGNYQVAAEGRWFKLGLGSPNWLGGPYGSACWEFDYDTSSWIDHGDICISDNNAICGCALYDPVDRQLIKITSQGANPVQFLALDTLTQVLRSGADMASSSVISAAIDPVRRKLIYRTGSDYTSLLFVVDLNNKTAGWTTVPMTGTAPGPTHMFYWHSASGAFLSWDTNHGLMKLTPTLSGSNYIGAVWSTVTGLSGLTPVMPGDIAGGMWSRIQFDDDFCDSGSAAMFIVPNYSSPDLHVMRLTGAV